ncbi:MAG: hydrogenase expression protein HypE [Actinomycetota bacterium]|nr:hydrogenase expression protein HypE [Actinomycetota bacterium]
MVDRQAGGAGGTPARDLLDLLGPVDTFHDTTHLGKFGMPSGAMTEDMLAPVATATNATRFGPLEKVHAFWFAGMSCDGCSVAVTGATNPSVESLMLGAHPGVPRVVLHHPVINMESGPYYLKAAEEAIAGTLDAPYVVILEGSIADETIAHVQGGYWSATGEEPWGPDGALRSVSSTEWVARLAPNAAAMLAIGTCATWGGVPSAAGNPTGAMSLMDFLGKDYRSVLGVPVVNVPGCPPVGDNFTETVAAVLYFLQGFGPLPEFDELGRPAWLFGETVHRRCVRGAYYEEGTFAEEFGDPECLVEVGCWGPVVNCNITSRGAIRGIGGCMNAGGACIGCTMPGFPDKFTPFYTRPPGSLASTTVSRMVGSVIRPLRKFSKNNLDREVRWDVEDRTPSAFSRQRSEPSVMSDVGHKFYDRLRRHGDRALREADVWGNRPEESADDPESPRHLAPTETT